MVIRSVVHGIILLVYTLAFCVPVPAGSRCTCRPSSGESGCAEACAVAATECSCSEHGTPDSHGDGCCAHREGAFGKNGRDCGGKTGDYAVSPCRCALHAHAAAEKEHLGEAKVRAGRSDSAVVVMASDTGFAGISAVPARMSISRLSPPGGTLQHRCHILII